MTRGDNFLCKQQAYVGAEWNVDLINKYLLKEKKGAWDISFKERKQ